MAIFQFSFCKASLEDWGFLVTLYTFGLKMPFLDLVIIECVFPTVLKRDDDTMGALESWQFSKWVVVLTRGMRAIGEGDEAVEIEETGCLE